MECRFCKETTDGDQNMQLGAEHVATVVILEAMSRGTEWLRELG
jgi:hypothetical protein